MARVAVIGGGVTRLVCAYELVGAGSECVLIEPQHLGGVIRTRHRGGFTLEDGPSVFLGKPEFLALLDELGLTPEITYPANEPYERHVFQEGQAYAVPTGPFALLRSRLLPLRARLSIVAGIIGGRKLPSVPDDLSVFDLLAPLWGVEAAERIADPALRGIYGGDLRRLSARSLFPEFWSAAVEGRSVRELMGAKRGARARAIVLRGGNETLVTRLSDRFVERGGRVVSSAASALIREDQGFQVRTVSGETLVVERVAVATSGAASAVFLRSLDAGLADLVRRISYAPLFVVHCGIPGDAAIPHGSFGVLNPSSSGSPILGYMFRSELFPHVAPEGRGLVTVCLGGVGNEAVTTLSESAATALVAEDLHHHFGIEEIEPLGIAVWERAIPQLEVGHFTLVEAMRRAEERYPGLMLLGVDIGAIGVPDRAAQVKICLNHHLPGFFSKKKNRVNGD